MADRLLILFIVMGVPQMIRGAVRRFRSIGGCRICYVLGQIPYGPPYWLLRTHLHWVGHRIDMAD